MRRVVWLWAMAVALAVYGCATPTPPTGETPAKPAASVVRIDRALEDRILVLDPEHLNGDDVRMLAQGPAPRIILIHGGIYPVHLLMVSFGRFLVGMGYPERQIRDPGNRDWSYSPYQESAELAGLVAWAYEHDGMRPMIVGHSQGGMQAVKVLRELTGKMSPEIHVWNPVTHAAEARTTIVDPLTGNDRPIIGLSIGYASAVGAGGAAFLLPNQWNMIGRLRSIPDSVDEFTGFFIALDSVAWTGSGAEDPYTKNGTANVRNVELPATYNHLTLPLTQDLPRDPQTRDWINAYFPGSKADPSELPGDASLHVLWAADVWYSIKKHWCLEAQRLIRARRERGKPAEE
jgi:hypothetical protein